jgi:hypothetical protein
MRLAGVVLTMLLCCGAPASAAVTAGPAHPIFGPTTGDDEQVPTINSLSAANADGNHVAGILDREALFSGDPANFFGVVVGADGRPVGEPQLWSTDEVAFSAYSAVNGGTGVAVWLVDTEERFGNYSLMMRRFDARTAEPLGEPERLGLTSDLYGIEAYRNGYVLSHEIGKGRAIFADQLTTLDAEGNPVGEPRVVKEGRGRFVPRLHPSPSGKRLLLISVRGNSLDIERFGPDGRSKRTRTPGIRDEYVYEVVHATGGTWMTMWANERGDLFTRRLPPAGGLGPRVQTGLKAPSSLSLSFNDGKGLLLMRAKRRSCRFSAIQIDPRGRLIGNRKPFALDCGSERPAVGSSWLVPGSDGRFLFALTAFNKGAEHFAFASGLRLR